MKVLIMISGLARGGGETNIVSVLPYLKKIEGVTPLLCTLNTSRDGSLVEEFRKTKITRFDLDVKRLIDPVGWRRFFSLLHGEEIDIISAQDQYTNLFGALAYWYTNVPVIMTRNVMQEPVGSFRESIKARMMLRAARYCCDKVIAVSEAVRQNLALQAKVPLSKITTIHNGIDVEYFAAKKDRDTKRAEMGWALDQPIIIMVAVLRRGKGHEVLFQAIPLLKSAIPNFRIVLVGDGELDRNLRHQASFLGDTVEFLGERMDLPELLGASDVLVLPSWSEGLPTVLIEAGAASLPVVATNVGGTGEIVVDGETGYLVPSGNPKLLADRLITVLKNLKQAREMGRNAHKRVTSLFSLKTQAQKMVELYKNVLGEV